MARHSDLRIALSLDSLNFFLADVRDGLGPYLAIYLLAVHQWEPASIGVVMTLAGIAALLTQGPAGALIDRTRSKRAVVAIAALLVTGSCLMLPFVSSFGWVALTQAASAVAASVFAPAISAISLGITGPRAFTRRTGRKRDLQPRWQCRGRVAGRRVGVPVRAGGGVLPDGPYGGRQCHCGQLRAGQGD